MKFLIDAQLPRRLADWLNECGHDALHTLSLPRANRTTDDQIIARADAENRMIVTKDADFVDSFQIYGRPRSLLLISTGNISNDALVQLWSQHLATVVRAAESASYVELTSDAVVTHV